MALTDMFQIGGGFDTAATTLYSMGKWLLALGVVALLFWWLYNKKQYKYEVKLKLFQNEQFVYYQSLAKVKTVDGANFWYIRGLKQLVTVPPAASMYLGSNGHWIAEGYYDRLAGVIWSRDTMSKSDFMKIVEELQKKGDRSGTGIADTHYQPMSTTERSLQAHQVTKAILRKGKDIWAMIWQILPILVMVVIFALILIFWNDIAKPIIALEASNAQISQDNKFMQEQNIRLYQMLTGGKGNGTHYIIQSIPADQQYFIPSFPGGNTS